MRRALQSLLARLPHRGARKLDRRLRPTGSRRAQFVSFLESSGYRTHNVDAYERSLQRRRFAKAALVWASAFAVAWVVIESARAVSIF
jgi:uroporphyrinogen-III synthase